MKQVVTLSDGRTKKLSTQVSNPEWELYYILHDYELNPPPGRDWENNLPEVIKLGGRNAFLNKEWQMFWMGLNSNIKYAKDKYGNPISKESAFTKYTGAAVAFTDAYHSANSRNWVEMNNLGAPQNIAHEYITCGGNVILCRPNGTANTYDVFGLDVTKPPPVGMSYWTHPHLIQHATNKLSNPIVNPFGHMGGRTPEGIVPVYSFIPSLPIQIPTVDKKRVQKVLPDPNGKFVVNGQRYNLRNPYNPAGKIMYWE